MKVLVIGAGNMGLTYSEGMASSPLLGKHNLKIFDTDPKCVWHQFPGFWPLGAR